MKDFTNYSLLPYNTFGMDVKAARFVEYESVDELQCFLNGRQEKDAPLLHVGRGSNLLFVSDYSGTVLHSGIKGMQVVQETEDFVDLRVGAGEVWDDLVDYTVQKGWYGAENLSLIPGEVGASAVQNIGAYGVEAKDLIVAVETVSVATGELRVFTNEACRYAYRESIFIGVVLGLLVFGKSLDFFAMLGLLGLIGMNIKNAIVLVDEIGLQLNAGLSPVNAVIEATKTRIVPVTMASGTTILGMLPLLGDAMFAGMAATIMGGLFVSTILTIFVLPVTYCVFFKIKSE